MMTDIVPPEDRVRAFSLNYWAINLGFAIAPVLGGLLASSGYLTLFLVDAGTTLVFAVLVFLKVPESRPEVVVAEGERPGLDGRRAARPGVPVLRAAHRSASRSSSCSTCRRCRCRWTTTG